MKFLKSKKANFDFESLYIHIPFCKKKCLYCDFYSVSDKKGSIKNFFDSLKAEYEEFRSLTDLSSIKTIYIGGGTPSLLLPEEIEALSSSIFSFNDFEIEEFTFEANPESIDLAKMVSLKKIGVTRISLGVQSLDDEILRFLGRIHSSEDARKAAREIKNLGFDLNIDIIYGIPGQTFGSLVDTVKQVVYLEPDSISAYALTVKKDTFNGLPLKSSEAYFEEYLYIVEFLRKNGYRHYEVSNWAHDGKESKHNLNYWLRKNYLGLGPSAASLIDDVRFSNEPSVTKYLTNNSAYFLEVLNEDQILLERFYLAMRTSLGFDISQSVTLNVEFLKEFVNQGLLEVSDNRIVPTDRGMFVLDSIVASLIA
ncbi:MAG: radical SAM family heme chaperone HemW [Actinobacteria bacterium]|nr:radical SAM family heme chaperone HemW [Actinomycetota bacterium]